MEFIRKMMNKDSQENETDSSLKQDKGMNEAADTLNKNKMEHHPGLVDQSTNDKQTTTTTTTTTVVFHSKIDGNYKEQQMDAVMVVTGQPQDLTNINQNNLEKEKAKEQLSHFLSEHKKDRQTLVEQGILDGHVADSLICNKKELEKKLTGVKIEKSLRRRHSKEELTDLGVIKEGLQPSLHALEQEQNKIKLKHKLAERPDVKELEAKHILETDDCIAERKQRRATAAKLMKEHIQKFKEQTN